MTRKILFSIDGRIHRPLRHLSVDTGRTLSDLLSEAVTLLLSHHGVRHAVNSSGDEALPGSETTP
jgi:hypothetical protein